jgi:Mce-associated membrane protein
MTAHRAKALYGRVYEGLADRPEKAVRNVAVVAAILIVLSGLLWFTANRYDNIDKARTDSMSAAKSSVVKLMSYNYRSIDRQADEMKGLITGHFKDEYLQFLSSQIAPTAKDRQIAVHSAVVRQSVVSATPTQVVLLTLIAQESDSALKPNTTLTENALRVTLDVEEGKWMISDLTPV